MKKAFKLPPSVIGIATGVLVAGGMYILYQRFKPKPVAMPRPRPKSLMPLKPGSPGSPGSPGTSGALPPSVDCTKREKSFDVVQGTTFSQGCPPGFKLLTAIGPDGRPQQSYTCGPIGCP